MEVLLPDTVDTHNSMNKLICGDNLEELAKLEKESVDLIYIDPPFFSHKQYEVVWGDEAEVRSFEDRWEGNIEHYIDWMKPRIELLHEILKTTGSFYLHCDWHANAHLRILLDNIFGDKNFRNEIVWCYKRWPAKQNNFQQMHDTILRYSKTDDVVWNQLYDDFTEQTKKRIKDGKKIEHYVGKSGKVLIRATEVKSPGVAMCDYWNIPMIAGQAKERLGYPTQKPEALLERIIKASSNKDDVVLDAFCGCGTSLAVAQRLGRRWIGIDISPTAIKTVEKRLGQLKAVRDVDYVVLGMPKTIKELKRLKPFEFQNWVINEMRARHSRKKVGDMGVDGYIPRSLYHTEAGIQVKQSEDIGRNVVDNFVAALQRAKYSKGYIVAFSFGKGAVEEVARLKNAGKLHIELVTVEDLLYKKRILS